jgi:putative transcriptional regulator
MIFEPIEVDRPNLTIMGVKFSNLKELEATASSLGSAMFEGFKPTKNSIVIIRDYISGKLTINQLIKLAKEKAYA